MFNEKEIKELFDSPKFKRSQTEYISNEKIYEKMNLDNIMFSRQILHIKLLESLKHYFEKEKKTTYIKVVDILINDILSDQLNFKSDDLTYEKMDKLKNENNDMKYAVSWLEEYSTIKQKKIINRQLNQLPTSFLKRKSVNDLGDIKNILEKELKNSNKIKSTKKLIPLLNNPNNISIDRNFIIFNEKLINNIENENFNIFELDKEVGREQTLGIICFYIFNSFGMYNLIRYPYFENFIIKISKGYIRENPYHNDLHAGDVTQTCMIFLRKGKINDYIKLDLYSLCALILSCIIHDFKHPGLTNNFLVNTQNKIAIRYNDKSVLENYHIAEAFKIIKKDSDYDIFNDMDKTESSLIRKKMIQCVLSTDMINHTKIFSFIKLINEKEIDLENIFDNLNEVSKNERQQNFMDLIIHACDISNPTKPYEIYKIWANKVMNEFYLQGDKEKELGIPISFLCDRNTTSIPQGQIGFIEGVVFPFFDTFAKMFKGLWFTIDNMENNKNEFLKIKEEDEKKKKL